MIIGKSNHPVTVKRIEVKVWRLRDEIESIIAERLENSSSDDINIQDIKAFYGPQNEEETIQENPVDDDPLEMLKEVDAESTEDEEKMDNEDATSTFARQAPAPEKLSLGFTLLSDINMTEVLIFTKKPFVQGSSIVIELQIPKKFIVSAEVIKCVHISRNSKIISEKRPEYRVHAKFTYPHVLEKDNLRAFLRSIELEIPPSPKKIRKPQEEEDDDFEDLGL